MTLPGPHSNGNDHEPAAPGAEQTPDASLAERLQAMGLGEVGGSEDVQDSTEGPLTRLSGMGAGPSGGASQGLTALSTRLDNLSAGLTAQADHLRDSERSLVDRIADVDDDRRRTQGQLQRAMQSQYDEIDARLGRLGGLTTLGLCLIAALAAGALYLIHYLHDQRIGELQGDLTAEMQTLGLELNRLTGAAAQGEQVQNKLAALSTALAGVSEDLARVGAERQTEAPAAAPDLGPLGNQIDRLASEQQRLSTELDALRAARQAEAPSTAAGTAALTGQMAGLQSEQQRLIAEIDSLRAALAAATVNPPRPEEAQSGTAPEAQIEQAQTEPTSTTEAATELPQSQWAPQPDAAAEPEPSTDPSASSTETARSPDKTMAQAQGQAVTTEQTFALQLIGSYNREAVLDLAGRPDLPDQVFLRQETLRGRPWFVLIHSLHPSYAEAQAALERLPADLARLDTWIRSLPPDAAMEPVRSGRAP